MTEDDYRPTGRNSGIRLYGLCWWWLRSPGNNQNNAANVNNNGDVNENGNNVNNDNNAVRPALLSYGPKLLCKYAKPVPRVKESDSLSNFSGKYMSVARVMLFRFILYGKKVVVHGYLFALPMDFNYDGLRKTIRLSKSL